MSFFQNVFSEDFRGSIPFGDRQYSITWKVPANKNTNQSMIAWNFEPYNLTGNTNLTINYAIDKDYKNYVAVTVDVSGATPGATLASEIAEELNADAGFADRFIASIATSGTQKRVGIKAKVDRIAIRAYISNSSAEKILRFNKYAGVAELPTYFARHTVANRFTFTDSLACLIALDESNATDQAIITDAGFNYSAMQADWQLLDGRAGIFNFKKQTIDGSNRITQIIEYPAGAGVGDLGKKTTYTYTAANTNADKICEIPYTLTSGDLVTP